MLVLLQQVTRIQTELGQEAFKLLLTHDLFRLLLFHKLSMLDKQGSTMQQPLARTLMEEIQQLKLLETLVKIA